MTNPSLFKRIGIFLWACPFGPGCPRYTVAAPIPHAASGLLHRSVFNDDRFLFNSNFPAPIGNHIQ